MRTISSIRTAALVVVPGATAYSQRAEPRPPPSQDQTTMGGDTKRILDAVHAGADLGGRQS